MKRLSLISFTVLACLSLSACGTNSKQAKQESEASSLKIANSKLKKKVNKHSVKKTNNNNSSSSTDSSIQQNNQQTQSNGSQQASSNNGTGQLPPSIDLHDFVNRYGESPAAYMMDHYGMSQQQALNSTPDNMKSSGELQYQEGIRQGYIQP